MKDSPLVSIVVITYNSSKYVLETLESAKAQTYQNIELIISDDCSTDNTVEICRHWIEENKNRFVRTELIFVPQNTGVPANCNRGVKATIGEWVKLIAGDDILMPLCIATFLSSIDENTKLIVSELIDFVNLNELDSYNETEGLCINPMFINLITAKEQFLYFLKGFYIPGSSTFFKKDQLIKFDGFDENYPLVEDRPLFLKYTFNGYTIKYISDITVGHRRHSEGLTANSNEIIIPKYLEQTNQAILHYAKLHKNKMYVLNPYWHNYLISIILKLGNKGYFCHLLNELRLTFQPIRFFNLLVKFKIISNF